jgi:hypothetical protein
MAVKYICDTCNTEVPDPVTQPEVELKFHGVRLNIRITRAIDGTWNGGIVCVTCLREALQDFGTDRLPIKKTIGSLRPNEEPVDA